MGASTPSLPNSLPAAGNSVQELRLHSLSLCSVKSPSWEAVRKSLPASCGVCEVSRAFIQASCWLIVLQRMSNMIGLRGSCLAFCCARWASRMMSSKSFCSSLFKSDFSCNNDCHDGYGRENASSPPLPSPQPMDLKLWIDAHTQLVKVFIESRGQHAAQFCSAFLVKIVAAE